MNTILAWLPLIIMAFIGIAIFCCRNWLITKIKASIEHDFNAKLKTLESELRTRENEISTLRDTVFRGSSQRQAIVDKRKIEAVDNIWKGVVQLQRFKAISSVMATINLENAAKESVKDPNVRKFFESINKMAPKLESLELETAITERPFVTPIVWTYFSALQIILWGALTRAKMLELGVVDADKFIKADYEKKLLKAALPHQQTYIDTYEAAGYYYLIEELEENLLKELNNILDGKTSDQEALKRASDLQKEMDKMNAENGSSAL